jgi:hypothetical protein
VSSPPFGQDTARPVAAPGAPAAAAPDARLAAAPDALPAAASGALPVPAPDAPAAAAPASPDEALALSAEEGAAVAESAVAFGAALPAERGERYRALAASALSGSVPAEAAGLLEQVCSLALETGKARQLGRAEAERLLSSVLSRTPRGRAMADEVSAVNRALGQLAGRPLRTARVAQRMPGHYDLSLSVAGFSLTLEIKPDGISVRSLNAG